MKDIDTEIYDCSPLSPYVSLSLSLSLFCLSSVPEQNHSLTLRYPAVILLTMEGHSNQQFVVASTNGFDASVYAHESAQSNQFQSLRQGVPTRSCGDDSLKAKTPNVASHRAS